MVAGVEIHPINPQQNRTAHDQGETDDPDVEQHRFDDIVRERADDGRRQECDQHTDDETPSCRIAEHTCGNSPDTKKIDRQQREDRAELDEHREGLAEIVIVESEKALHQEEVAGRGHRQELGQPLNHTEDEGLEQVEQHDGSAARGREVPRRSRRGRSGRCAFPASLTLGQRERANIAQVALGRPYPKDRGRPNVTAVARPARANLAAVIKTAC